MFLLKLVYCFCIKDLENRKVNTLTEVKSHLTVNSLHSFWGQRYKLACSRTNHKTLITVPAVFRFDL